MNQCKAREKWSKTKQDPLESIYPSSLSFSLRGKPSRKLVSGQDVNFELEKPARVLQRNVQWTPMFPLGPRNTATRFLKTITLWHKDHVKSPFPAMYLQCVLFNYNNLGKLHQKTQLSCFKKKHSSKPKNTWLRSSSSPIPPMPPMPLAPPIPLTPQRQS